ncbi:MAG: hypothetical protein ACFFG0_29925 [Candidatus Thorarchaeota archaeon]
MPRNKKFFFVKNYILTYIHAKGFKCSGNVLNSEKLNEKIKSILDEAIRRAKENLRKTVFERDL